MGRAFLTWFWKQIDEEKVEMFVWGYYITLLTWGILAAFFVAPIRVVQNIMGHELYYAWVWMNIIGTLCVMTGLLLPGPKGHYLGLWLRLGGNACMGLVLFAFEYSGLKTLPLPRDDSLMIFILLAMAPYVLGCVFLALQASRQLWLIEKLKSEARKEGAL